MQSITVLCLVSSSCSTISLSEDADFLLKFFCAAAVLSAPTLNGASPPLGPPASGSSNDGETTLSPRPIHQLAPGNGGFQGPLRPLMIGISGVQGPSMGGNDEFQILPLPPMIGGNGDVQGRPSNGQGAWMKLPAGQQGGQ